MPCGFPEIQVAITSKTVGSCSYIHNIKIITARSHTAWANYAFLSLGLNPDYSASRISAKPFLDKRFQTQQHFFRLMFWKPLKPHSIPLC